jgi:DNA-binding response OmpR family regulator
LIVEDDAGIREALAEYLQMEGYRVATARNGAEGLERLEALNPSVVLLDLHMPVVNGEQFLVRMRSDQRLVALPVVLMTGSGAQSTVRRLPVQAVLGKPFEIEELVGLIRRLGSPP